MCDRERYPRERDRRLAYAKEYGNTQRGREVSRKARESRKDKTREYLKEYGNISWDNWEEVWELDHIKPLGSFDLTDRDQFVKACHYSKLRPLLVEDHKAKSAGEKRLRERT